MTAFLLSVHVLGAIVFIGPVTVAASLFPRYARTALTAPAGGQAAGVVAALHRISTGYAVAGLVVPVFGIATAHRMGVLTQAWLLTSMGLTILAAGLLGAVIVPGQRRIVAALDNLHDDRHGPDDQKNPSGRFGPDGARTLGRTLSRLGMVTGLFSLTWAVVVVLMIVRPGSTTGVHQ